LLFEHEQVFDGNLMTDRSNSTNPGGTDVFGRSPLHGKPGFQIGGLGLTTSSRVHRCGMRVGADLWNVDQAAWSAMRPTLRALWRVLATLT